MSFSARVVPPLLLALLSVSIHVRAQAPAKATPKTPKGTVSGRVTIKDKPAAGVPVGLRKIVSGGYLDQFKKATTDQNGVYRITNVEPGTYDILPSAPAYVVSDIGVNYMRGKNVIVGDDEDVEDINFSLVRGGVITGKVTDADGTPIIQQQVNLYSVAGSTQQPVRPYYASSQNMVTDDRGIYRFFGLPTGRYKVAAGRSDDLSSGPNSPSRLIYKQVFHPNATEAAKATVIDVHEGSEANDVDIKLGRALQTYSASGRVINSENGQPLSNIRFMLQRNAGERFELVQSYAVSNSSGDFVVDGLSPGKYGVFLSPDRTSSLRAEPIAFDVVDQDVSGITVRMTQGSTLTGVVVFEHEDKKAWAKLLELRLRAFVTPTTSAIGIAAPPAIISPDGSFELTGLSPGMLNVWLGTESGLNAPQGFTISRLEHNGVSRLPGGFELKEGEQLSGVRVFVSYGTGKLRGVVNVDAGLMPEGARLFARLSKAGMPGQILATSLVDARGHFLMEGIPAGVFEVTVIVSGIQMRSRPPSVKQEVTMQDGAVTEVSLTLDLTPDPKP